MSIKVTNGQNIIDVKQLIVDNIKVDNNTISTNAEYNPINIETVNSNIVFRVNGLDNSQQVYIKRVDEPNFPEHGSPVLTEYDLDLSLGNINVTTTETVVATDTVGAITAGSNVEIGTTFQDFIKQLLLKRFQPTKSPTNAPTATLTAGTTPSGTQEVGTVVDVGLTVNVNVGTIQGANVNGVWVSNSTAQGNYAGAPVFYHVDGTNSVTNTKTITNITLGDSAQTWSNSNVYLADGPQPVDNFGDNATSISKWNAGIVTAVSSASVSGSRKIFYGYDEVNVAVTSSAEVRSLSNSAFSISAAGVTITIPAGTKKMTVAMPSSRSLSSFNETTFGTPYADDFNLTTVSVEGANNYTAANYKVYTWIPLAGWPQTTSYVLKLS